MKKEHFLTRLILILNLCLLAALIPSALSLTSEEQVGQVSSLSEDSIKFISANSDISKSNNKLLATTTNLKFSSTMIYRPVYAYFYLINPSFVNSVRINNLFCNDVQFISMPSIVQHTTTLDNSDSIYISPLSQMLIKVLFIPRNIKKVTGILLINYSNDDYLEVYNNNLNTLKISLEGIGLNNIYDLRGFKNLFIAVNTIGVYPLFLRNSFHHNISILKIGSSEEFLSIAVSENIKNNNYKLLNNNTNTEQHLCDIVFLSPNHGVFNAYIYISLIDNNYNTNSNHKTILDFALPFKITTLISALAKFSTTIDFGTVIAGSSTKTHHFHVQNIGYVPLKIISIYPYSPDPSLKIEYNKDQILPHALKVPVANFSYSPTTSKVVSGKIILHYTTLNDNNATGSIYHFSSNDHLPSNPYNNAQLTQSSYIDVNYHVRSLSGYLEYNKKLTYFSFRLKSSDINFNFTRRFIFKNRFNLPITFLSANIDHPSFQIQDFVQNMTVVPTFSLKPFTVRFFPNKIHSRGIIYLNLKTNATTMSIPLHVYDGLPSIKTIPQLVLTKTHVSSSSSDIHNIGSLDFGNISNNSTLNLSIVILNRNPMKIKIGSLSCSMLHVSCILLSTKGIKKRSSIHPFSTNSTITIHPEQKISFLFSLHFLPQLISDSLNTSGNITLTSSIRKTKEISICSIDIHARILAGKIIFSPESLSFYPTYPGNSEIEVFPLFAKSKFSAPIFFDRFYSQDSRFILQMKEVELFPGINTFLGNISFDASKCSDDDNYMKHNINDYISDLDQNYESSYMIWSRLSNSSKVLPLHFDIFFSFNFGLSSITTSFPVSSKLFFPTITKSDVINFELVEINTSRSLYYSVYNPSSLFSIWVEPIAPSFNSPFSLLNVPSNRYHNLIDTTRILLPPNHSETLGTIVFTPLSLGFVSTSLYLRNNLTGLSKITLKGIGGKGPLLSVFSDLHGKTLFNEISLLLDISSLNIFRIDNSFFKYFSRNNSNFSHLNSITSSQFTLMNNDHADVTIYSVLFASNHGFAKCDDLGENFRRFSRLSSLSYSDYFSSIVCSSTKGFVTNSSIKFPFILPSNSKVNFTISYIPDYVSAYSEDILYVFSSRGELSILIHASYPSAIFSMLLPLFPFEWFDIAANIITLISFFGLIFLFARILFNEYTISTQLLKMEKIHEPISTQNEHNHSKKKFIKKQFSEKSKNNLNSPETAEMVRRRKKPSSHSKSPVINETLDASASKKFPKGHPPPQTSNTDSTSLVNSNDPSEKSTSETSISNSNIGNQVNTEEREFIKSDTASSNSKYLSPIPTQPKDYVETLKNSIKTENNHHDLMVSNETTQNIDLKEKTEIDDLSQSEEMDEFEVFEFDNYDENKETFESPSLRDSFSFDRQIDTSESPNTILSALQRSNSRPDYSNESEAIHDSNTNNQQYFNIHIPSDIRYPNSAEEQDLKQYNFSPYFSSFYKARHEKPIQLHRSSSRSFDNRFLFPRDEYLLPVHIESDEHHSAIDLLKSSSSSLDRPLPHNVSTKKPNAGVIGQKKPKK